MNRKKFIQNSILATGAIVAGSAALSSCDYSTTSQGYVPKERIKDVKSPLAIAMWDYTWILRHHPYGEFEHWEQVLLQLKERGYNAIRIDAMPHFIAKDTDNTLQETFRAKRDTWKPPMWGNKYSMTMTPRKDLVEFMTLCQKMKIKVGLSTWFMPHGTDREQIFNEPKGHQRAWLETLEFLDKQKLLDHVIYVDILNEYPSWHGFKWLSKKLEQIENKAEKIRFANQYATETIALLREHYPDMCYLASMDNGSHLETTNLKEYDAIDYHTWFVKKGGIPDIGTISQLPADGDYRKMNQHIIDFWAEHKTEYIQWMDQKLKSISNAGASKNIPVGTTEGWGPVQWINHPELSWEWVKECGEIAVDLALKYNNYKFICTSNFTHPQFKGIWNDVEWHKRLTNKIKNAKITQ